MSPILFLLILENVSLSFSTKVLWKVTENLATLEGSFSHQTSILLDEQKRVKNSSTNTNNKYDDKEALLTAIDEITNGFHCGDRKERSPLYSHLPSSLHTSSHQKIDTESVVYIPSDKLRLQYPSIAVKNRYKFTEDRIRFLAALLTSYNPKTDNYDLLRRAIDELKRLEKDIYQARIVWLRDQKADSLEAMVSIDWDSKRRAQDEKYEISIKKMVPWLTLIEANLHFKELIEKGQTNLAPNIDDPNSESGSFANWTKAYFACSSKLWLLSYTSLITHHVSSNGTSVLKGLISVDLNINKLDVNQCDTEDETDFRRDMSLHLFSTHKCHRMSSECIFAAGFGWRKGGYTCKCKKGYFSAAANSGAVENTVFNGSKVELAWSDKLAGNGLTYNVMFTCKKCAIGCDVCTDGSPCLSSYDWAFRISLLTISILCVLLTVLLGCYIYKYRKLKVFKVASPIFLCITLLGCAIMYSEMAAIFPVLDSFFCIVTKVTRHMGFCITYSALLLKTWRVSLTYRVKSAHKLKLTDKQLLQWLFPILLVMAIYLGTWTISAPPQAIYIEDWNGLKFKICDYNWWDHSIVIGEFLFLLWGIKVCYSVRNAESFFNEAKYITWAIYNIAIVNILMIFIHLLILPNAGADVKYFFGFLRTQLSTTTTMMLIFGPKFYRVLKGQGDSWDNRVRARGVNASFSLNGVGLVHEETSDLYQENEELKEEIHKLATQIELMKLMQMEINNRHLKAKHCGSSHHRTPSVTITANPVSVTNPVSATNPIQNPIVKAAYSRFEANDGPSPRISPAAELASERV